MIVNPEIKIRILREIKGYTQENIANELKISTKAYQKIESGETQLTISKLNKISKALGLEPLEILQFKEDHFFESLSKGSTNKSKVSDESISEKYDLDYIKSLKEEISFLRKIISKSLDL